jgi:hypothetical protein
MKRYAKLFLAGMLAMTTVGGSAWACNPRCQPVGGAIQRMPPANVRLQQLPPSPSPISLSANDVIVNDLPVEAKLAIRAAAKVRTNPGIRQPARSAR